MGASGGRTADRERHSARLALFRSFLALGYLTAEAFFSKTGLTRTAAAVVGLFVVYSILLLLYHSHRLIRSSNLSILFLDLIFLLSLVFASSSGVSAALAAIFYAFLVLESWSLHGGREVVLLATAVILVIYGARVAVGIVEPTVVTVHSVLFLLVVGGLLASLVSGQRYLVERRITAVAHQATGASETATALAIQEALKELANWLHCSCAVLGFWDRRNEHYCFSRYPADRNTAAPNSATSPDLEDSLEWSVLCGEHLTFIAEDVATKRNAGASTYDLHPHLIQKFEIRNAVGCGLYHDGHVIGRLLLINCLHPIHGSMLARLKRVTPAFTELARHVLVIKAVEDTAADRQRARLAQDFHDGPLQSVISFQMRVHTISKLLERDPVAAAAELDQLQELARKQVAEMRTFVNSMRPVEVDTSNLTAAARRIADDFQKESGVPVTFMSGEEPVSASGRVGVDVLQIIREALHNIHKHARATHVVLSIEEIENYLTIAVNDNGTGFRFGGKYSLAELETLRLGPNSIKQRVRALGGELLLESQPGHGTSLRLRIPLH